jgi:hypothetical protein
MVLIELLPNHATRAVHAMALHGCILHASYTTSHSMLHGAVDIIQAHVLLQHGLMLPRARSKAASCASKAQLQPKETTAAACNPAIGLLVGGLLLLLLLLLLLPLLLLLLPLLPCTHAQRPHCKKEPAARNTPNACKAAAEVANGRAHAMWGCRPGIMCLPACDAC